MGVVQVDTHVVLIVELVFPVEEAMGVLEVADLQVALDVADPIFSL